jgi:hypothetical protein
MSSRFKSKIAAATLILLLVLPILGVLFPAVNIAQVMASPGLTVTPPSGKVKTTFTVKGTEFGTNKKVGIGFGMEITETDIVIGTGDGSTKTFSATLTKPVKPGFVTVTDTVETFTDNGAGTLTGSKGGTGTINYVTGALSVTFKAAPATGRSITASYKHYAYDVTPTTIPTTNATGYFEAVCEVPLVATGTYTVTAINEVGYKETASFTVLRGITLVPSKGAVGTQVEIYGSGFTAGRTVTVYFDKNGNGIYESGEIWASKSVKSDGTFSFTDAEKKAVPSVTAGYRNYAVYATDGVVSAATYFTIAEPTISINYPKGTAGTPLTVYINYFTRGKDGQIFFDKNNNEQPDAGDIIITFSYTDLNNTGGIDTGKGLTVPEDVGFGTYKIVALNNVTQKAVTTFTVMQPVIAISPAFGIAGRTIEVKLGYYNQTTGAQPTYVFFDINGNGRLDSNIETKVTVSLDGVGNATISNFQIPSVAPGEYKIYANNSLGQVTYAVYTVKQPLVEISPTKGVAGTTVTINIYFFDPTKAVTIWIDVDRDGVIDDAEKLTTPFRPESNGNKTGVLGTIPAGVGYGIWTVNATNKPAGGAQSATTTFTVMHPVLEVTPEKGTAGTLVTVKVYWFNKTAGDISVWIDVNRNRVTEIAELITTIGAGALNNAGNATKSGADVKIPSGIGFGIWTVNASNNVQYATDTFTVEQPVIAISPDKGTAETEITVQVNYYNRTVATYVFFDTNKNGKYDSGEPRKDWTAAGAGALNNTGGKSDKLKVPAGVGYGTYTVYSNNSLGQVKSAAFTVMEPVMAISPTSGGEGTIVTVSINYYNKTVSTYVFFDTDGDGVCDASEPSSEVKARDLNNTGGAVATIQVPFGIGKGVYRIYAVNSYQSKYCEFTVVTPEETIEEKLDNIVIPRLNEIKAMLGNEDYGLAALKSAIGALSSRIEVIAGTIMDKLSAIEGKVDAIKAVVDAIKLKTDALPAWGDLVTKNFADLTGYIDSAKAEIIAAMPDLTPVESAIDAIEAKLDALPGYIDSAKADIIKAMPSLDLTPVLTAIKGNSTAIISAIDSAKADIIKAMPSLDLTPVLNELGSKTYGLAAIKNVVDAIEVKLDKAAPIVIEGTKICPNKGSVELFSVDKTMTNGAPFKVSFTIDATELDSGDSVYVEVYVKAKADSSLVMAQQILIYGRAGADRREVYMESLVNAEQVVVKLTYYAGTTSDDPIHFQAVIGSP